MAINFNPDIAGIKATSVNPKLVVFPNPADQNLNIRLDLKNQQATLNLYDLNGRRILSKTCSGNSQIESLSAASLANGIYSLQIVTADGTSTEKVVVAH
jgi:hypothetical protein